MELVRRGIASIVIERSAYNDLRIGEHLAPAGVLALRALDDRSHISLDAHLASAGVVAYWGSETANHMDYFLHPAQHGLNLSRPRFDADLARACELSDVTILRSASLARALKTKAGWDADIDVGGKSRNLRASVIVDGTGRAATFSRQQGARARAHDRQVAVVAFESGTSHPFVNTRSIVEATETGWWYGAPISPTQSICMFVTDDDLLPKRPHASLNAWWVDQLRRTAHMPQRFRDFSKSLRLVVRSARSQQLDVSFGAGWVAVGDAAIAFDPLTSQGIAKALDHGKRAASCISAYLSGETSSLESFSLQLKTEYAAYLTTRAQYYRLEMRWPRSPFWKRRHEDPVASRQ